MGTLGGLRKVASRKKRDEELQNKKKAGDGKYKVSISC